MTMGILRQQPPQAVHDVFAAVKVETRERLEASRGRNRRKIVREACQALKAKLDELGLKQYAKPQTKALRALFAEAAEVAVLPE
ncbi:hypothetical protein KKG24_00365 [Patescibacteria group bacterium]|nr:hypothetical protein [Patescibacteria group bacterium]